MISKLTKHFRTTNVIYDVEHKRLIFEVIESALEGLTADTHITGNAAHCNKFQEYYYPWLRSYFHN